MCFKLILMLLAINTGLPAYINANPIMGQIASETQVDRITVETDESPIYTVFYWDEEMQLWVRVLGQNGDKLGEFDMGKGNQITLSGTGKFTLEVFSLNGVGNWECECKNQEE